jgi:hypothetical protein
MTLLARSMDSSTPAPQIVPSTRGGVQLEWHTHGLDIEVLVLPTGRFSVYFEDLNSSEIDEHDVGNDDRLLRRALGELSGRIG